MEEKDPETRKEGDGNKNLGARGLRQPQARQWGLAICSTSRSATLDISSPYVSAHLWGLGVYYVNMVLFL